MGYSNIGIIGLIILLIVNRQSLKKSWKRKDLSENERKAASSYRNFLMTVLCFYVVDIGWGLFYAHHDIPMLYPVIYSLTVFYFIFMYLTMLTWLYYVDKYLNKGNRKSIALRHTVWLVFLVGMVSLMVNRFYHFIFSFNDAHEYTAEGGRYIAFLFQIVVYTIASVYLLVIAAKSEGEERVKYIAVGATSAAIELFLVLQILDPMLPFHSMGLLVGTCLIHSYVVENEISEKRFYDNIARSLAENYDMLYYVEVATGKYVGYGSNDVYGQLEIRQSGQDFFAESLANIPEIVHRNDRESVINFLDREHVASAMENMKRCTLTYRLIINGRSEYFRMIVRKTGDGSHYIVGVENIDKETRKEKQVLKALNTEKELARRDELTGIKNKTAYLELEQAVQANMDKGMDYLNFAIVVCDANDLKKINDNEGHVAGDEYIKASAKMICDAFSHSPVFRVGGDEFVAFLKADDYSMKEELLIKLRERVEDNQITKAGPVVATGMAAYEPSTDTLVSEIFDRADKAMYENKQKLKAMKE